MPEFNLLNIKIPTYYGINLYKNPQYKNCIIIRTGNYKDKYLSQIFKILNDNSINYVLININNYDKYYLFIIKNKHDKIQALKVQYYFKLKKLQHIKQQELRLMQKVLDTLQQLHTLIKE